ncbi:TatD family hydrolase [Chloroflexota bacterium]
MYKVIDTHCHLDELDDIESALKKAQVAGVIAVVACGLDYVSNNVVLELAQKYKSYVYAAIGVYPWTILDAPDSLDREVQFVQDNLKYAVCVGEVGLDYKKELVQQVGKEQQKEVFMAMIDLAVKHDKPLSIHSRYAWKDCLNLVKNTDAARAVFHWYTGPSSVLKSIVEGGYYVSACLASEYHYEHKRAVRETPLAKLLLETDTPVYYRGYRAMPVDTVRALAAVAELKELGLAEVAEKTTANAVQLFNII